LSTYYKCTLSAITHKLNVSGHILIWTFFVVLVCELVPKNFPHLSVPSCIQTSFQGRAIAQRVACLLLQLPWFGARSSPLEFMVENMALGHVFLKYSCASSHSTNCSTVINHPVIQREIVSIPTASLNNQLKKFIHEEDGWGMLHAW
jgi:hypothetical protein